MSRAPQVAVIGTGRLGTRLAEQLVLDRACKTVLLYNRSSRRLRGTLLTLGLWSEIIHARVRLREVEWGSVARIDIVVMAVKEDYDPRDLLETGDQPAWLPHNLRYVGLSRDIHLVRQVCAKLRGFSGTIVVITNPVDVVTALVQKWVPTASVLGVGLTVDEARVACLLRRTAPSLRRRIRCPLGGEHGSGIVPLYSLWQPSPRQLRGLGIEPSALVAQASEVGVHLVRDLGYTLHDCAVVFSQDIAWLLGGNHASGYRSFCTAESGLPVGRPLRRGRNRRLHPVPLHAQEERQIRRVAARLAKIADAAEQEWLTS